MDPLASSWELTTVRGTRRRSAILLATLGAMTVLLVMYGVRVAASTRTDTLHLTVRGASDTQDGALPEIALDGMRFDQVSATIDQIVLDAQTAGVAPHAQLIAAPPGMSDLELLDAHVERTDLADLPDPDPGTRAMSFRGMLTAEDPDAAPIEVLVTARWATTSSIAPETAVFFRWTEAVLSEFVPLSTEEVELLGTWIAFRRAADLDDIAPLVVPATLTPDTTDYLDDGRDSTTDDFSVHPTNLDNLQAAIAFRGVVDHEGALADTLAQIGLSNTLRLDGEISVSKIDKYVCPDFTPNGTGQNCKLTKTPRTLTAAGVNLTASIPINDADTGRLPDNVYQGADWSLHIAANTAGQVDVDLGGTVVVTISDMIVHLRGTIGFTHDPANGIDQVTFGLGADEIVDAFGLEWLDFDSIGATLSYTSLSETRKKKSPPPAQPPKQTAVFGLDLSAVLRLGSIDPNFGAETATATFGIASGSGGFNTELSLSTDADLSLNRLLAIAGAPQSDAFDVGVNGFGLAIKFATDTTSAQPKPTFTDDPNDPFAPPTVEWNIPPTTTATVAFRGTAFLGWGATATDGTAATISTDVFTRFVINQNGLLDGYFVDVRGSDNVTTTVGQIIGEDLGQLDVELPSFGVSVSDRTWSVLAIDLDPVTLAYTGNKPLGCGTLNAYCIREGVRLNASVHLSGPLAVALAELGPVADPQTPLVISGVIPMLGSTEFGLAIQLPTFATPEDQPGAFRAGTLALAFGKRVPVGATVPEFYFELTGTATVRVASPGSEYTDANGATAICPDVSDGMTSYPRDCQDDLTFTVVAGVSASVKTGVSIVGDFGLTTEAGGWHEPFGVHGLTVHSLGLHLEVTSGGTSSPTPQVQIGLQGAVTVDATTINLSFLLAITPTPPYVKPLGFTFATNSLGIANLVDLYEAVSGETVDTSNLPDLWFEDVYLAFGLVDEPTLCIRTGFLLAAELHFDENGEPTADHGSVPVCNRNGNLPPANFDELPQSCGTDPTCLAAVLIDVRFGTTIEAIVDSRLIAKGYFAPSNIGPLEFDETRLELELSATKQQFLVQGGVKVINPLYNSAVDPPSLYYLAEGSFTLDITLSRLYVEIEAVLGGDQGLGVYIEGEATFQDDGGKFSLDNPTFQLVVQLRTEALDRLAADVEQAFEDLGMAVEEFGPIVETATNDAAADIEQLLVDLGAAIDNVSSAIQKEVIKAVLATIAEARVWIGEINGLIDEANKLFKALDPDNYTPIASVNIDGLIDIVLHGYNGGSWPIHIPGFRWPGGDCFTVEVGDTCWTLYYTLDLSFDGVCDDAVAKNSVVCTDSDPARAIATMATEEFEALASATGLDLGAIGDAGGSTLRFAAGVHALSTTTTTVSSQQVLTSLNEEFSGAGVVADCASTTLLVDENGGTQTPLDISLDANGAAANFGTEINLATGNFAADGQTYQDGVSSIVQANLAGSGTATSCQIPPAKSTPPPVTIDLRDGAGSTAETVSKINEGDTVWAHGTATEASTVTVDWGDGVSTTGVVVTSGAWVTSHTFADDGNYDVTATGNTGGSATSRLVVENVAPTITTTITAPVTTWTNDCGTSCAHVDEGELVTVHVTITDPGILDDHTVVVQWGDGTRSAPQALAAGAAEALEFSHYFVDGENPYTDRLLLVTANDHDRRGTAIDRHLIRVHNDAPSVEGLTITAVDGCAEEPCATGSPSGWWSEEGAIVAIDIDLHDQGSYDGLTLHVDWGDGSPITTVPVAAPLTHPSVPEPWLASLTRTVSLEHTYLDDAGTGTATDDTISVWVEDADGADSLAGGSEPPLDDTFGIQVRNDVPVVLDVVPITVDGVDVRDEDPTSFTFDETAVVVFEVTVKDEGVLDDIAVDVNWGDGQYDWSTGTSQVTLSPPSDGADDCAAAPWDCDVRTTTFTHHWDDDQGASETDAAPTVSDDYTVTVNATDKDDETSPDVTRTITIDDVVPVVGTFSVTPSAAVTPSDDAEAAHVENRSDATVELAFDDVSVYDSHVVTIDWGAGWTGGTYDAGLVAMGEHPIVLDARTRTERYTVFTVEAPWTGASTTREVTLLNRYGDNGDYTIAVDVLDDDTLRDDDDSVLLEVLNELPVHGIDRQLAVSTGQAFTTVGPTTTWFDTAESDVVFEDDANDVGSDDLAFSWSTNDHTGGRYAALQSMRWLADVSGYLGGVWDLLPSPLVDASQWLMALGVLDRTQEHVTNELIHAWDQACLYGVTASVVDDDGGSPPADHVPVVIQRLRAEGDASFRNFGQWKNDINEGTVSQGTLDCYLDIAGHLSSVLTGFSEMDDTTVGGDPTPWVTRVGDVDARQRDGLLPSLFVDAPGRGRSKLETEQSKLDRSLLSALMNLADGAFAWNTELEVGTPFWKTIQEIEEIRVNSKDAKLVSDARRRLWIIGIG